MSKFVVKSLVAATAVAAGYSSSSYADTSSVLQMEEVVVTAQKRSESLQSVPISIVAMTSESLAAAGISNVKSLQESVPGLTVGNDGMYSNPSIRGVGSQLAGSGQSANVATYVDGFYRPNQITSNMEFVDIASVQVLKGPQGTLFGRNATGGAILLTTKTPSFNPEGNVRVSYGSYNDLAIAGYASTGLTDTIAGSLSLFRHSGDGFVENVVTGHDDAQFESYGARGKLLWNFSSTTNFLLALDYSKTDDPTANATGVYKGESNATRLPPSVLALMGVSTVYAPDGSRKVAGDAPAIGKSEVMGAGLTADFEFDWATFTSYTQARHERTDIGLDLDGTNAPVFSAIWSQEDKMFSQEFNLAQSDQGPIDWVTGAFFYRDRSAQPEFNGLAFGAPGYATFFTTHADTRAFALYGDATYNFAEQWYATLGLRYGTEKEEGTYSGPAAGIPSTTVEKSWNSFTPRFVLRYELSPETSIYASQGKGYKSGAFNLSGFQNEPVNPEKIDATEIGLKSAGARWRIETAAFYYDYKDLQTSEWHSTQAILKNAAKAKIYGFDFHGSALVTDSLSVDLSGAYTHARYDSFPAAGFYTWSPGIVVGPGDATGNKMTRTPELSAVLGATYTVPVAAGKLATNLNYSWQSKIYYDPANTIFQDSYGLLNARVSWNSSTSGFGAAVFCNNATNEKYINQILAQSLYIGQGMGKPRTVGIELTQKF